MTDDPQTLTDISDKSWDDLYDADHSIKRELAAERDGVDGNATGEQIAAEILAFEGRADEVPDEYQHYTDAEAEPPADDAGGESDDESAGEPEEDAGGVGDDDAGESDDSEPEGGESAEDEGEQGDLGSSSAPGGEPRRDSSFIAPASVLQDWLDHINALVDEAKINFGRDGLAVRAVDAANVGMVDTVATERAFDSFSVGEEGVIGVNTVRIDDVLKGASADQLVSLDYVAERRNLVIHYGGHEFTLALITPESIRKEPDLPDLDLPVRVEVDTDDLKDAIKHADWVSDHVSFRAEGNEFEIAAEGDTDDYAWTGEAPEDVTFLSPPGDDVYESLYSLDYLKDIVRTYERGQTVTIDLGQEFPVRLTSALHHDEEEVGPVTYMVAPRIQSD